MKINIDLKKGSEAVSGALGKAADLGAKAARGAQAGAKDLLDKSKQEAWQHKLKKYNPLFPDRYFSEDFHLPNMIMIRDDAERRGIDVCEGAIGWLGTQSSMEILYLYDEAVELSGLQFVPPATCDTIYCVDPYDRTRFISIDSIFSVAHNEKLAELAHIAFCLGASRCTVELTEADAQSSASRKSTSVGQSASIKGFKLSANSSSDSSFAQSSSSFRSGIIETKFSGKREPKMPTLKWFQHDYTIKQLLDECLGGENTVEQKTITLEGASSATMSQKAAKAVDSALGKIGGMKGKTSMETQATKECRTKIIFHLEF